MARTARLNTGRSAEFADSAVGGSENGLALTSTEVIYTGGSEGFGAIADVTGVTFSFDLAVAGLVQFFCSGAALANSFIQGNYLGLAINVNGTDYYINGTGEQGFNGAGGGNLVSSGFTSGNAISGHLVLDLVAGSYTVKLRAFGSGYLESSANFPTKLTAVYPVITGDVATVATLTRQEVGPFAGSRNTVALEYEEFGTPIEISLASPQIVIVGAYTHFKDPGSNSIVGQLGVRVTSPGPTVTDYEGQKALGGNDDNAKGSSLFRAILLPIGTSTLELIARDPNSGAVIEWENAFLTAVYNSPQEVVRGTDVIADYHTDIDIDPDATQQEICSLPFEVGGDQSILIDFSAFEMVVHKGNNITITYEIDSDGEKNGCKVQLYNQNPTTGADEPFGAPGSFRRYEAVADGSHTLHIYAYVEVDNPNPTEGIGGIKAPVDVLVIGK